MWIGRRNSVQEYVTSKLAAAPPIPRGAFEARSRSANGWITERGQTRHNK